MANKIKNLVETPESITEDELKSIQEVVGKMNKTQMDIGRIEFQKHHILHGLTTLEDEMRKHQESIKEKYGEVNINIQDGTITKPEDVEADKKD